ncbi:MAG: hypothetical protein HY902_06745 [Deltaproteobacteria bacterium]|nr:hypothetical protein [Deltaproteobacteria bacterium]
MRPAMPTSCPLPPPRSAAAAAMLALLVLAAMGCDKAAAPCPADACPAGFRCEPSSGECQLIQPRQTKEIPLFGAITTVPSPSGPPAVVGYAADRQSLAALDSSGLFYVAGPAAVGGEEPAGQTSAAWRGSDQRLRVAWIRENDRILWLSEQTAGGWKRTKVAGEAVGPLAMTEHKAALTVAYRRADATGLRVATRQAGEAWLIEDVPLPPPPLGQTAPVHDLGRSLSMVSMASGLAVSAYDATYGDLVLAVKVGASWSVSRLFGSDPASGADLGDMGNPAVLAAGPDGELVVAYRDATAGSVVLSRSQGGVMARKTVATGLRAGPNGTQLRDLLGTSLALAVRTDGRAVVAWFNARQWRVGYAVEKPGGTFEPGSLPPGSDGGAEAWPALSVAADGAVWMTWVALQPAHGPAGSRVGQAKILQGVP